MKQKVKEIRNSKAFTLIELIVVIAVLGILVLLAAPKFLGYTAEAKLTQIKNDIKAYETSITAKLTKDPSLAESWASVPTDEVNKYKDDNKLIDTKGVIDYELKGEFIDIPEADIDIKSDLKGDFIMDSGGKVYYYDDNFKAPSGNGNNGGNTGGNTGGTTPPTPPEDPNGDNDNDGFTNAVEDAAGTDKNDPNSKPTLPEDPNGDNDGDGFTNAVEDAGGTDKNDPLDYPIVPSNTTVKKFIVDGSDYNSNAYIIDNNNDVYAIGTNNTGATGSGHKNVLTQWTKTNLPAGVKVEDVISIDNSTTLFITTDKEVYGAGMNAYLGFGINDFNSTLTPIKLSGSSKVKEYTQTHILYENGDLYFTGGSGANESGIGSSSGITGYRIVASDVSKIIYSERNVGQYNFVKRNDGKFLGSGYTETDRNNPKTLQLEELWTSQNNGLFGVVINNFTKFTLDEVKDIAPYQATTNFLLNNGDVISDKIVAHAQYHTNIPFDATKADGEKALSNIKSLETLGEYSIDGVLALSNSGEVYGYGINSNGLLQLGHKNVVENWTLIPELSNKNIEEFIITSDTHVIYRTKGNKFFGYGTYPSIGLNSATPVEINLNF